ncbi:MAG TPA: lysylphosphatidylglycerol synthase transmembrane domain-containing protein [Vicinamibacterales bacterium]|nr:lysylphosphatidylglycerol synthase transmembrane domain-containing protein [Vicinamibacterales bacterium]
MQEVRALPPRRPRIHPIAVVAAIAGVLLFIYTLQASGPREIFRQLGQIGFGFLVVLALSAIRMALRAKAWSLCVEDGEHFTFGQAFKAYITGDAVGNVLPLGPLASEGTKALLIRRNIATSAAFSSVVLENIFYSISVAIMVMVGTLAFLLGYQPTNAALTITLGLGAVAIVAVIAVWWLMRTQPRLLSRFLQHDAVRDAEDRIFRFTETRPKHVWQILLLQFSFHVASVLEIYFLLRLLLGHTERTLLLAIILGTVERLIMIAFKFVPLRLGVDHAGSGGIAQLIGLSIPIGVTIATVRTARNLFWAAVGLAMLARSTRKRPALNSGP